MPDNELGDYDIVPMPQSREELNELVSQLRKLTNAADHVEAVRKRRIARVNAAADDRVAPLIPRIKALAETILMAAGANWDDFNKGARAPLTMKFSEGVMKRNDGKVGKLVVNDLEAALAFLEKLDDAGNFIKIERSVKKNPVKEWLDENPDRRVPGTEIEHVASVTLKIEQSPVAEQAGIKPHEFSRTLT